MTETPRSGSIEDTPLNAILAGLGAEGFCGRIELNFGEREGLVQLRQNEVVAAQLGDAHGVVALAGALGQRSGRFAAKNAQVPGTEGLGSVAELLEQAAAIADQVTVYSERVGGMEQIWAVRLRALSNILSTLPPAVQPILRLLDGRRTVAQVLSASELDDRLVLRILGRLLSKGVLVLPDARLGNTELDAAADFAASVQVPPPPAAADLDWRAEALSNLSARAQSVSSPTADSDSEPATEPAVEPVRPLPPVSDEKPARTPGPPSDVGLKMWSSADASGGWMEAEADGFAQQLATDPARPSVLSAAALAQNSTPSTEEAGDAPALDAWLGDEEAFFRSQPPVHARLGGVEVSAPHGKAPGPANSLLIAAVLVGTMALVVLALLAAH